MIELLYSRCYEPLLRYCLSLTHNRALSEDVVQDAFLRALANAPLLNELPEAKCRAWLYKTARNLIIDRARRVAREPRADIPETFEADFGAVHVAQMVSRLPENERALFTLRYFHGYNATELGEMFDLPPATVRARLLSSRTKLKQMLEDK